jgi:hypothetical protein
VNQYKPGQSVRFTAVFTQVGGPLVNPPSVVCTAHSPSGTTYPTVPVNDSTGNYHADFLVPLGETPGIWASRWQAIGGIPNQNALQEEFFQVVPLDF